MGTLSFRNVMLRGFGALLLLLGAAGCSGAPSGESPDDAATPAAAETVAEEKPVPGYRAPEILGRDVRNGRTVRLSDYRGQVVMVNFWATWCPYCREHMAAVEEYFHQRGEAVQVIAVAADGREPVEAVAAYVQGHGLSFPVLYDGGVAGATYRAFGLPTTVFVDPDGIVRIRISEPLTPEQMAELAVWTASAGEPPAETQAETGG